MRIRKPKNIREFVGFIYAHYRDDREWIPPLRSEQKKLFDPRKNNTLQHYEYELLIAEENNKIAGRVAVFIDPHYNEYWQQKTGFFGSFECVNNPQISKQLLDYCKEWLRQRGMQHMRGPISFESQNWGLVYENITSANRPRIMSPYNPHYYNDLLSEYGMKKIKDLQTDDLGL